MWLKYCHCCLILNDTNNLTIQWIVVFVGYIGSGIVSHKGCGYHYFNLPNSVDLSSEQSMYTVFPWLIPHSQLHSTLMQYCWNTNNIDIVVIFISNTPSWIVPHSWIVTTLLNSTICHFETLGITANHHVMMIISSIIFDL